MRPRRRDRVVGWIALTIVLAMAVSLALNMLFIELGGVWARPALDRSNLLREVASLTRVMDAAPPALRPRLAGAAVSHDPAYRVRWTARLAELRLPEGIDLNLHDGAGELRAHLSRPDTRILVVQPDQWPAHGGQRGYLLAIQLGDGSWLAFGAPYRSWGLDPLPRLLISLGLVLISTLLVAAVATRRLARPLQAFTRAARRFGADMRAPPIEPQGPYELREATLTLGRADGRILIRVCDRGPGLPEAQLEKVTEPFYRLEGSRNRSTGGVGLGLATARAVLSEEGGSLTLSNRPGGGLCATLTLPEGEGQAAALSR